MSAAHFQRWRMRIEPLSPIHIGSGATIEPYEYALERNDNGCWLIALDTDRLLSDLSPQQRAEFNSVVEKGDFPGVREWLRRLRRLLRKPEYEHFVVQVQDQAYEQLSANQDNPDRLGEIHLFTRRADTGEPYIPGSSVKGAIRTALVDAAAAAEDKHDELLRVARRSTGGRRPVRSSALFEAHALGHLKNDKPDLYHDPLRQIAVADAPMRSPDCYIDRVHIVPQAKSQNRGAASSAGPIIYRDVTWSMLDGEAVRAEADFRLYTGFTDRRRMGRETLPRAWSIDQIIERCNGYYLEEIEYQLDEFTPRDEVHDSEIREPLLRARDSLAPNQCIIRLGRHSHYECMVVSKPFNAFGDRGGKSRTYVDGRLPLGWARLTFEPAP